MIDDSDISAEALLRIVCAAVICKRNGQVYAGVRHRFIMKTREFPRGATQGFLTNQNQFLNRQDAWTVAEAAGQIRPHPAQVVGELHSEDLY